MQIATPGNAQYGNHLDHETILALTAPKEESVRLVQDWLQKEASGAKVATVGDFVTVEATVNSIEKLLKTEYSSFGTPKLEPVSAIGSNHRSERKYAGEDVANARIQSSLRACRPC